MVEKQKLKKPLVENYVGMVREASDWTIMVTCPLRTNQRSPENARTCPDVVRMSKNNTTSARLKMACKQRNIQR